MGDWPGQGGGNRIATYGADTADSTGVSVSAAGSANTKGSWVEVASSLDFDAAALLVHFHGESDRAHLLDIGVGAASSEQVIVPDLAEWAPRFYHEHAGERYLVPVSVPAGSRLAARNQCEVANGSVGVVVTAMAGSWLTPPPLGRVQACGADTAASMGTTVTAAGSANTKGSWTELVASTDFDARLAIVAVQDETTADYHGLVDIGVGAASSEQVIVPDLPVAANATPDVIRNPAIGPLPVSIPAGSRIAARWQCTSASRSVQVVVYLIG